MCNISDGIYNDGRTDGIIEGRKEGKAELMTQTVSLLRELGFSKENAIAKLIDNYHVAKDNAENYVNIVWQKNA